MQLFGLRRRMPQQLFRPPQASSPRGPTAVEFLCMLEVLVEARHSPSYDMQGFL